MKRILLSVLIVLVAFIGCKKDNYDFSNPLDKDIPSMPSRFSQNLLIEQFTQSTCGQCPGADLLVDSALSIYGNRLSVVNVHTYDSLQADALVDTSTGANVLDSYFNLAGTYPSGMVNRDISNVSPANYLSALATNLGNVPRCGIALDANDITNGYLNLEVHVGFADDLAGAYRLHLYLVEKEYVTTDSTFDQWNDFSQFGPTPLPGTALFDLPAMINGYSFTYVLRDILDLGGWEGEEIPAGTAIKGKEYIKNYIIDVRSLTPSKYEIIAFVDKYGSSGATHRVENVQRVTLGQVASWN